MRVTRKHDDDFFCLDNELFRGLDAAAEVRGLGFEGFQAVTAVSRNFKFAVLFLDVFLDLSLLLGAWESLPFSDAQFFLILSGCEFP